MSFKAISFTLVAAAALLCQPAFAEGEEGSGLAGGAGGTLGTAAPIVAGATGVVALGTASKSNSPAGTTPTATATATASN